MPRNRPTQHRGKAGSCSSRQTCWLCRRARAACWPLPSMAPMVVPTQRGLASYPWAEDVEHAVMTNIGRSPALGLRASVWRIDNDGKPVSQAGVDVDSRFVEAKTDTSIARSSNAWCISYPEAACSARPPLPGFLRADMAYDVEPVESDRGVRRERLPSDLECRALGEVSQRSRLL